MVLADTSVWIDHFRRKNDSLAALLTDGVVLTHSFVTGELACGNLQNRNLILAQLRALPRAVRASDDEAMRVIESHELWGSGLGWVDVHLLASALLSKCRLWTMDKRLAAVADKIASA